MRTKSGESKIISRFQKIQLPLYLSFSTHPQQEVVESHPNPVTHSQPHTSHSAPTLNPNHSGSDLQHEDISILRDKGYQKYLKGVSLFALWLLFALLLVTTNEKSTYNKNISLSANESKYVAILEKPNNEKAVVALKAPFLPEEFDIEKHRDYLSAQVEAYSESLKEYIGEEGEIWQVPIPPYGQFDLVKNLKRQHIFHFGSVADRIDLANPDVKMRLKLWTTANETFPLNLMIDSKPMNTDIGIILAAIILILLYVLIIWEIVHRTFAAILISTLSIAILAALHDRPTMKDLILWIDSETIILLFSMMIIVAILTETGVFDYLAVYTFKVTGGKIWPLVHGLGIVTMVISAFLDNVTTVLLMTPITIRLCEVMELNPVPILMSIIVHANVGGTATPVGDPPNVIITSHPYIAKHGVSFLSFTLHMTLGVIFVAIQTNLQLRLTYRHINDLRLKEPKEIKNLRREITVWKRASESISSYSKDADLVRETLQKKVKILQHKLKKLKVIGVPETTKYNATLEQLQKQYPIKNKPLLWKCSFILVFIIILCIVQSFPEIQRLSVAWCALLGTILLLIITFRDDMDHLMHRIEWTTLLFFAAMFIIMEALERLGLINWIGKQTEQLILSVDESYRLAVSIILILWISGLTSSLVDSIPVTSMMVRVVVSLAQNSSLNLPLSPLVWALAFGPCLGGNGTLVGASANVVCAGIAEQHGYKISFIEYFK